MNIGISAEMLRQTVVRVSNSNDTRKPSSILFLLSFVFLFCSRANSTMHVLTMGCNNPLKLNCLLADHPRYYSNQSFLFLLFCFFLHDYEINGIISNARLSCNTFLLPSFFKKIYNRQARYPRRGIIASVNL